MQLLNDICNETGLSIDDARMCLMDIREDWGVTDTVTDSEAQLIRQSTNAALPGSSGEIIPVPDMPIQDQQALVNNVAQVLGQDLVLSVQERIQIASAVDQITNQVILTNREASIRNLGQEIAAQDEQIKAEYAQVITTLQGLIQPTPEAPKRTGMDEFNKAIANIQKKLTR